jgi:hypothetical protein
LSGPETQIMTGAASARFPKRCSISGRADPARVGWLESKGCRVAVPVLRFPLCGRFGIACRPSSAVAF